MENKFLRENHAGFKGNEMPEEDSHCIYLLVS